MASLYRVRIDWRAVSWHGKGWKRCRRSISRGEGDHAPESNRPPLLAIAFGWPPDEFGHIIPGYDSYPAPALFEEADDPCQGQNFDPDVPRRTVPSHYHQGLSLGADLAATATCHAVRLLGDEDTVQANAACQRVLGTP